MILNHPDYEGLKVYVGIQPQSGGGYFYVPQHNETLSGISLFAYNSGALNPGVLRINRSAWNRANCVYRTKSTSCLDSNSPKVDSALALIQSSWADGAWLALCPKDRQGAYDFMALAYPMLWIPTVLGEEPGDLSVIPSPGVLKPKPEIGIDPGTPAGPIDAPEKPYGGGVTIESESSFPWGWIIAGFAVGIGGYAYYQGKKHPGRRRAGARV